jgi:hypothetical protein
VRVTHYSDRAAVVERYKPTLLELIRRRPGRTCKQYAIMMPAAAWDTRLVKSIARELKNDGLIDIHRRRKESYTIIEEDGRPVTG